MNAVATTEPRPTLATGGRIQPVIPQTMEDAYRLGKAICAAGMAPRGMETPEKCMVAILRGLEVGLSPMQAVDKIAVVNGRPTIWGDGAMALVRASGLCEFVRERIDGEGDARVAICESKRKGETEPVMRRFSVADAKEAGLWAKQGPWKQFPARMLQMRARAFTLRDLYADVLGGLYLREEIEEDRQQGRTDGPTPPPVAAETRPQELAPPAATSAGPSAPPAEEAEFTEAPSSAEGGGPAAEQPAMAQEEPFDPEAWLDEVRDRFAEARTEADVDSVHEVFSDTVDGLGMVERQRYEDLHGAALQRVAATGQPEQAEATGEPGPAPHDEEDDFPGAPAIQQQPEKTEAEIYAEKVRACINAEGRTRVSLASSVNQLQPERDRLILAGKMTNDFANALHEEMRAEWKRLPSSPKEASKPAAPPADQDPAATFDAEFRARVAACTTIDEVNAVGTDTLKRRNEFGSEHPMYLGWRQALQDRRMQIGGLAG